MEEEKHLLSNHADIEAIITAIEHFLHVETFPDERNLLEESRLREGRFRNSSDRLWGELYFSTHYINNERYQRKIGVSISMIIIVAPFAAIMKDQVEQLKRFGNTATAIGWGQ